MATNENIQVEAAEDQAVDSAHAPEASEPAATPVTDERRQLREKLGLSRTQVCQATGLNLSTVWRTEQPGKLVDTATITLVDDFLENVRVNGVPAELVKTKKEPITKAKTATRAELTARLAEVTSLLEQAGQVKALKEVRALVEQALVVAVGQAADQPSGEDQGAPVDGQGEPADEQGGATPEPSAA